MNGVLLFGVIVGALGVVFGLAAGYAGSRWEKNFGQDDTKAS